MLERRDQTILYPCTYGEGINRKSYTNNTVGEIIVEDSPYCPMIINGKTNNTIEIRDDNTFRLPGIDDNIIFKENNYPQPLFKKSRSKKSKGTKKSKATKKSKGTNKSKGTKKSKGAKKSKGTKKSN